MTKQIINGTKELKDRATAPKNMFWRRMRTTGLIVAGIGTLITTAPLSLPVAVVSWGSYLITVGTTITGISQLTKN